MITASDLRDAPANWILTAVGVLLSIGVLALAGYLLSIFADDFRQEAGLSGTPGTFTATACHTKGSGRFSIHTCTGTFVSSDGRLRDTAARTRNQPVDLGKPGRLRRTPDGGYVKPEAATAAMGLALIFGVVGGAAFLLMALCAMPRRVVINTDLPLRANPQPWRMLLLFFSRLCVVFLSAAVLSLLAGVLLVFGGMLI